MLRAHVLPVLSGILLCASAAGAQGQAPQQLNWSADDSKRIAALHQAGMRTDGQKAVLWTPPGAIDCAHAAQLMERLDKGVTELRLVIGSHSWQYVKDQRIVFYVSDDQFVSHALGDESVIIPLIRLQDGRAPFIHEAAHALVSRGPFSDQQPLAPAVLDRVRATRPQWLTEGIADYLAQTAVKRAVITDGDVFDNGGIDQIDTTCARRLATPAGQEIAPLIGSTGTFPALFTTERGKYAPAFYACAFSYTKYLAALIGNNELIGLMDLMSKIDRSTNPVTIGPDGVLPRIEKLTGKSAPAVRAEWLASLAGK